MIVDADVDVNVRVPTPAFGTYDVMFALGGAFFQLPRYLPNLRYLTPFFFSRVEGEARLGFALHLGEKRVGGGRALSGWECSDL